MIRRQLLAGFLAVVAVPANARRPVKVVSWAGEFARARVPGIGVVRDEAGWRALWAQTLDADPPVPLPPGSVGVVIQLGPRPTGGFRVEIVGHEQRDCADVLSIAAHEPGPGAFVPQAITTPWAIALIPAGDRPVIIEKQERGERRIVIPESEAARLAQSGEGCAGRLAQP